MAWISGNYYLNQNEMQNNASIIKDRLLVKGWTIEAISAILGNMQTESTINPGIWEGLQDHNLSGGFGLVQWTPATKYINWAGGDEASWNNGDRELDRIQYEAENNLQWFSNPDATPPDPPITFLEFTRATDTPEHLAAFFLWYYEHPADPHQPIRGTQARQWYNYLQQSAVMRRAYEWFIERCDNAHVGYSQQYRNQQTIDGITYYDCSSLIWYALLYAGFDVVAAHGGSNWPFVTQTMGAVLERLGFVKIAPDVVWLEGDICVEPSSHCEMVYHGTGQGQGYTMGAHSGPPTPLPDQVSINNFISTTADFPVVYRFGGGIPPVVIKQRSMPLWMYLWP